MEFVVAALGSVAGHLYISASIVQKLHIMCTHIHTCICTIRTNLSTYVGCQAVYICRGCSFTWLFFAKFVALISTSFSILVLYIWVLYQFLLHIFFLIPPNYPGLRPLNSCVNLTGVVQWLTLTLSKRSRWVGVFPPHLRTEIDPVFETSCFVISRMPVDGESPKTQ
jgi:hypothetical protein